MRTLGQVNITNCQNYFFNSMTNIKNFDLSLLSINQISVKSTDCVIYGVEYFKNFDNKKSLYLVFNNVEAYIEKYNEDKNLVFALTDKNKEALENYTELWDEVKDQIELISDNEPTEYKKDFMKIKFESDDDLSLGKVLNIPLCVIIVRFVFRENNRYYPQFFYMNVFMSMNMNWKMILMLLYE